MTKSIFTLFFLFTSLLSIAQLKTKKYERNITNNSENEIAPFLSLDGKTLIYTRKRDMEDHWKTQISTFKNGKWQRATSFDILNLFPEQRLLGSYALNKDASKVLFVSKKYGGVGLYDIWLTTKNKNGEWSTPENLAKPINSTEEEINPIFSQDEESIYFVRRAQGTDNGTVYQSKARNNVLWNKPVKLGFTGSFFAIRIAADNQTMYLSKIIKDGETEMYVSRRTNDKWSEPIQVKDFPKNSDKFFATNSKSTNLTISTKLELTYDLYQIQLPEEFTSTPVTNLTIAINEPHKVKITKENDPKFSILSNNVNELLLLNDDVYTISILFKDYYPIVNEVNLKGLGHSEKSIAPRPIELEVEKIAVLDFFTEDNTIHESLFRSEIDALKAFAYANPTKSFEVTYFQKDITIDSIQSETHFTEVIDTIATCSKDTVATIRTRYSNDNSKTMIKELQNLCGILPNNLKIVGKTEDLDTFTKKAGVYVTLK